MRIHSVNFKRAHVSDAPVHLRQTEVLVVVAVHRVPDLPPPGVALLAVTACMTAATAYMTAYLLSPLTLRYSTVSNSVITVPRPSPGLLSLLARLPIVDLSRGTYVIMLCILVSLCRELIEQILF